MSKKASVAEQVVVELDRDLLGVHVLVVDSSEATRGLVCARLKRRFPSIQVMDARDGKRSLEASQVDVAIAHLTECRAEELTLVVEHAWLQLCSAVFWAEDLRCPQVAAARALGIEKVLRGDELLGWIEDALPALVRTSRARRELSASQREIPPIPHWPGGDVDRPVQPTTLPRAETLFREHYVRHILAREPNKRRAAEIAGVPYRTFCDILKKLDIA